MMLVMLAMTLGVACTNVRTREADERDFPKFTAEKFCTAEEFDHKEGPYNRLKLEVDALKDESKGFLTEAEQANLETTTVLSENAEQIVEKKNIERRLELLYADVEALANKLDASDDELKALADRKTSAEQEKNAGKRALEAIEQAIKGLSGELDSRSTDNENAANLIIELEAQRTEHLTSAAEAGSAIAQFDTDIGREETATRELDVTIGERDERVTVLSGEVTELTTRAEAAGLSLASINGAIDKLNTDIAAKKAEIEKMGEENPKILAKKTTELQGKKAANKQLKDELTEMTGELETLLSANGRRSAEMLLASKHHNLAKDLGDKRINELEKSIREATERLQALRDETVKRNKAVVALDETISNKSRDAKNSRGVVDELKQSHVGVAIKNAAAMDLAIETLKTNEGLIHVPKDLLAAAKVGDEGDDDTAGSSESLAALSHTGVNKLTTPSVSSDDAFGVAVKSAL